MTVMKPSFIDLSHHNWESNPNLDFRRAKAAGVLGVVYKATEGATFVDPFLDKTRAAVKAAGLLWGVYHFATAAPADQQATNFLTHAKPDHNSFVALDFEHNAPNPANTTTPAIARDLLKRFEKALGRKPKFYTGSFMFDCFGTKPQADLAAYQLWWAAYTAQAPKLHPTWSDYWAWQYTDGAAGAGQKSVDGIGACDCDYFPGDAVDLASEWV
jgi:lysozyme